MRSMTLEEYKDWRKYVKCRWGSCAGGMGLAGQGKCIFNGEWNNPDCPKYISDDDYEKAGHND